MELKASLLSIVAKPFDEAEVWEMLQKRLGITDPIVLHRLCREMAIKHNREAFLAAIRKGKRDESR